VPGLRSSIVHDPPSTAVTHEPDTSSVVPSATDCRPQTMNAAFADLLINKGPAGTSGENPGLQNFRT
jgi:hypothetical protein